MSMGALLFTALVGTLSTAVAGEGVIEINQALAMEGGVTSGDAPGFPVTVNEPGSYALTGNLNVTADVGAIEIRANRVSLDLRGFQVAGSGGGSDVDGIYVVLSEGGTITEVRNGSVTNFSGTLVSLGLSGRLLNLRLSVGGSGGGTGQDGQIIDNTVLAISSHGLAAARNTVFRGNVVRGIGNVGIRCTGSSASCVIEDNIVSGFQTALLADSSIIRNNRIRGSSYCIYGVFNLIVDNYLGGCTTGVRAATDSFLASRAHNNFRGNVISADTAIDSDWPDFFLGPNRCRGTTCQ